MQIKRKQLSIEEAVEPQLYTQEFIFGPYDACPFKLTASVLSTLASSLLPVAPQTPRALLDFMLSLPSVKNELLSTLQHIIGLSGEWEMSEINGVEREEVGTLYDVLEQVGITFEVEEPLVLASYIIIRKGAIDVLTDTDTRRYPDNFCLIAE
ncbi:hypothetical protein AOQ84DRAFT_377516 [Glonium stellatum]|uniref:Uncharacterized protein n=1 Tax=Glonium stellatum TaxID=574774 RepID=A0A8E2JS50_9PEZI|nr:hypothetical protein AOQ84DRAFT_377516 [Glonium stellatum]